MVDMSPTKRKNFTLTEQTLQMLSDLSETNTGGNESQLMRNIILMLHKKPSALDLSPPASRARSR